MLIGFFASLQLNPKLKIAKPWSLPQSNGFLKPQTGFLKAEGSTLGPHGFFVEE